MEQLRKILILSSSYGGGHNQAAHAIREAFLERDPTFDVRIIDYLQMVHPIINSITRYSFIKSIKYFPSFYKLLYQLTDQPLPSSLLQKRLNQVGSDKLNNFLQEFEPNVVISTFPTPAGVISELKERGLINTPSFTVITDHGIHSQWIQSSTDLYFVGSDFVCQKLMRRGVPKHKIAVTGIPIRNVFNKPINPKELQQKYQLDRDCLTVLIMGGSYGVFHDVTNICNELLDFSYPVQALIVCGHNQKLYQSVRKFQNMDPTRFKVFGFIREIHELMAVSDLIITKAGGLTISEALAMELPMLLYRPIPGQEQQNAIFLTDSKVALLVNSQEEFSNFLQMLSLKRMDILQTIRENTKHLKKPDAANDIVERIVHHIHSGVVVL